MDRVIHTGDITKGSTLDLFGELNCPLYGVFGNNDVERHGLEIACSKHGFEFEEAPLRLRWHDRSIVVVHDPRVVR